MSLPVNKNNAYRNKPHRDYSMLIMLALTALLGVAMLLYMKPGPSGSRVGDGTVSETAQRTDSLAEETDTPAIAPPQAGELRIAVGSDLHLDQDHADRSGELGAVSYNLDLVDALLWDARQKGAEVLLLTGDLVNGGRAYRHEVLAEKLCQAEEDGITVYVLPGNHDLAPIGQTEFAAFYADFGFDEAFSRDRTSLSYSILRDDLMILMLDTAGYRAGAIDLPEAPQRDNNDAFLSEGTLRWIESQLKEAQSRRIHVLCAGHYNMLSDYSHIPGSGFYLENADRLAQLLREYSVPLYLSGHMHVQAIYQEDGLTELLTEYLMNYPSGYSLLDLSEETIRFTPVRINVDAWAAETGQTDPVLLHFTSWQKETLRAYCRATVASMAERNALREDEVEKAADFFYAVMVAYWDGTLAEKRDMLETMPGRQAFFHSADGYSYGRWLQDMIDFASPLMQGFTLNWKTSP
ncbi:MAG: metallophosphoesterase [Clostridia bacterium]|nr:metallophosphoesterase [Clostridia bacterium]